MEEEGILFLNELVNSLEEAILKLEICYNEKNVENLEKLKQIIFDIQNKILEEIK